jgi:hypothetical protein
VVGRRDWIDLPAFALLGWLCWLPLRRIDWSGLGTRAGTVFAGAVVGGVLPLFLLGYDWGRWIHMAVFPLSLLAVTAIATGPVRFSRPFSPALALVYLGSWSLWHATLALEM